jgi:hypothetical protein
LISFLQHGDYFGQNATGVYNYGLSYTYQLTPLGARAPSGIITFPILKTQLTPSASGACYFTLGCGLNSAIQVTTLAQQNVTSAVNSTMISSISTNLSQGIWIGTTLGAAVAECYINMHGYYDNRGKDGYSP